jgi:transposase InsO family protein
VDRGKADRFNYNGQGGIIHQRNYVQVGIPKNIITDNGTQFTAREFKDFYANLGIKINYALVSHLQSNDQVERSNGMILQGLDPRIFYRIKPYARKWVKELPSVF